MNRTFSSIFGTTTVVSQGRPVQLVGLALSDLLITQSGIVSPAYGGMVNFYGQSCSTMLTFFNQRLYY